MNFPHLFEPILIGPAARVQAAARAAGPGASADDW